MAEMTKERADRIVANPDNYTPEAVSKAKEFLQNKVNKVTMSEERARKILANPDNYTADAVAKANDFIAIQSAGMSAPGANWVRKYMPVNTNGGFNFNWRQSLDTDVKNDAEGLKKLEDYRKGKMWDVGDDVNLNNIATEMHFKQANEKWTDFINSDRFPEFQNYLKDVQKYQQDKRLNEIWNDESNLAVDFMLPVTKEYAKNHYQEIEDVSDIAAPLAFDVGTNVIMAGPGSTAIKKPLVSAVYGNVAAPALTELGNVVVNDKDIDKALVGTAEGALVNRGTTKFLRGLGNAFKAPITNSEKRTVQQMVNNAADEAARVDRLTQKGVPYTANNPTDEVIEYTQIIPAKRNWYGKKVEPAKKVFYSTDVAKSNADFPSGSRTYKPLQEMPNEALTREDWNKFVQGKPFIYKDKNKVGEKIATIQDAGAEYLQAETIAKKATSLAEHGDLRNLTPAELRQLGFADKESLFNYALRNLDVFLEENPSIANYLGNMSGRPKFGQRGLGTALNTLWPDLGLFKDDSKEKEKSRLEKAYGF
jgi:fructose-specific component phosphotransferase system IIB-like protein